MHPPNSVIFFPFQQCMRRRDYLVPSASVDFVGWQSTAQGYFGNPNWPGPVPRGWLPQIVRPAFSWRPGVWIPGAQDRKAILQAVEFHCRQWGVFEQVSRTWRTETAARRREYKARAEERDSLLEQGAKLLVSGGDVEEAQISTQLYSFGRVVRAVLHDGDDENRDEL